MWVKSGMCSFSALGNLGDQEEECVRWKEGPLYGGATLCWIYLDSYSQERNFMTLIC